MKKIRALLTKINDAIRPPHVGPQQSTSITARGGTLNASDAARIAGHEAGQSEMPGMHQ